MSRTCWRNSQITRIYPTGWFFRMKMERTTLFPFTSGPKSRSHTDERLISHYLILLVYRAEKFNVQSELLPFKHHLIINFSY